MAVVPISAVARRSGVVVTEAFAQQMVMGCTAKNGPLPTPRVGEREWARAGSFAIAAEEHFAVRRHRCLAAGGVLGTIPAHQGKY